MSASEVLARTLRGLEWIARDEVRSRLGINEITIGHRELRFAVPSLTENLQALGTVDDVFLVLVDVEGMTRRRESLARLASLALNLDKVAQLLGRDGPRTVGVTASFLGRRNYNRFELEDAIAAATGWTHVAKDGTLSLRVHVVGEVATVAARIVHAPLHRRAYRVATVPGSVHPPLARALALLACEPFVDPFCGAGTIPIEGALAGLATRGSDIDPRAVKAARINAVAAGLDLSFEVLDASTLGDVDCVVTNPPWGRMLPAAVTQLPPAKRIVLLTEAAPSLPGILHRQTVRIHGAVATITVAERRL